MAKNDSAVELEENLSILAQTFYQELHKIAEQRLKLERETIRAIKSDLLEQNLLDRKAKPENVPKIFTVRLESSLGEKLAKSRGTADELEDKLQETRIAYEDKMKTISRMKEELHRREQILVQSIQEIEVYIRAVFYLKQEADAMFCQLQNTSKDQDRTLKRLRKRRSDTETKKGSISKALTALRSSKLFLEKIVSDMPTYSTLRDLVEHYLVLETLQKELLDWEAECTKQQEELASDQEDLEEYNRSIPAIVVAKESTILELKSELKNLKYETAQLEEQIDQTIVTKIREDAAWYDLQRWIKKLHLDSAEIIRTPGAEDPAVDCVKRLDRLKEFVGKAFDILERLKEA